MTAIPLSELGLSVPVLAAPMAGGPTTPALVIAAARAGSLGFLAAGYRTADALAAAIEETAAHTPTFGVNLFAPNPVVVDPHAYARYREHVRRDADRFGVTVPDLPVEDDDHWLDKIELLLARPVPIVSFTFGLPDAASMTALHDAGSILVQTVTSAEEARLAADAGFDALAVQSPAAGGHSGTFTPERVMAEQPLAQLLVEVGRAVDLPLIAAGGLVEPSAVAAAMRHGAQAVLVGTALLLAPESGTSAVHRAALTDPTRGDTVITRAYTGRPARALRNAFLDEHQADAPLGYPALHHLTSPMRKAAAAAGDPEYVNLWAGTGYRAISARPAGQIIGELAAGM